MHSGVWLFFLIYQNQQSVTKYNIPSMSRASLERHEVCQIWSPNKTIQDKKKKNPYLSALCLSWSPSNKLFSNYILLYARRPVAVLRTCRFYGSFWIYFFPWLLMSFGIKWEQPWQSKAGQEWKRTEPPSQCLATVAEATTTFLYNENCRPSFELLLQMNLLFYFLFLFLCVLNFSLLWSFLYAFLFSVPLFVSTTCNNKLLIINHFSLDSQLYQLPVLPTF